MNVLLIVLAVVFMAFPVYASTDQACMSRCDEAGSAYSFCKEKCSYGESGKNVDLMSGKIDVMESSRKAYRESQDSMMAVVEARRRREEAVRACYIRFVDAGYSKDNVLAICGK
jgi:hypothetical protein